MQSLRYSPKWQDADDTSAYINGQALMRGCDSLPRRGYGLNTAAPVSWPLRNRSRA